MLSKMPDGYTIAYAATTNRGRILELVPEGETVAAWTEMITVQVLRNENGLTLSAFRSCMQDFWGNVFPGSSSELVEDRWEDKYRVTIWSSAAPINRRTGKPEMTWFKASVRNRKILIVQKAFKFQPSPDQIAYWIGFLREVRVRDAQAVP